LGMSTAATAGSASPPAGAGAGGAGIAAPPPDSVAAAAAAADRDIEQGGGDRAPLIPRRAPPVGAGGAAADAGAGAAAGEMPAAGVMPTEGETWLCRTPPGRLAHRCPLKYYGSVIRHCRVCRRQVHGAFQCHEHHYDLCVRCWETLRIQPAVDARLPVHPPLLNRLPNYILQPPVYALFRGAQQRMRDAEGDQQQAAEFAQGYNIGDPDAEDPIILSAKWIRCCFVSTVILYLGWTIFLIVWSFLLANKYEDSPCEENIVSWLRASAIWHIVSLIVTAASFGICPTQIGDLVFIIWGASLVYAMNYSSHYCADQVFMFAFWYITAWISLYSLLCICVGCIACCIVATTFAQG